MRTTTCINNFFFIIYFLNNKVRVKSFPMFFRTLVDSPSGYPLGSNAQITNTNIYIYFFSKALVYRCVKGSFALVVALHAAKIEILITGALKRHRTAALLLVIEFIKIKHRAGRIISKNAMTTVRARWPPRAIFLVFARSGKISNRKYLSGKKVTSFQLSVSTLFASSLCIDRRDAVCSPLPAIINFSICK